MKSGTEPRRWHATKALLRSMRLKLLGVVAALGIAGSVLSNTSLARADAYLVDATFQPTSNYPSNFPATVSGTIDITGGFITSANLVVPAAALPFTYSNTSFFQQTFVYVFDIQDPNSPSLGAHELLYFSIIPDNLLSNMQMGTINFGYIFHYFNARPRGQNH